VAGAGLVVLLVAIVVFWSKGEAGSAKEFCASLRTGENPLDVFDRYDPTNVATARGELQQGADRLRELRQAAPRQLQDDMDVLVNVADELVRVLDPQGGDKSTVPDFTAEFDKVSAASGNVTRFAASNCGIDLDSGSSAPAPTQN
jgi:hypothetical protein